MRKFIALLLFASLATAQASSNVSSDKKTNSIEKQAYQPDQALILYQQNCASCHGEDRLGLIGPPLIPASFKRLKPKSATMVIKNGRLATQMPPFGQTLNAAEINQLVQFIFQPPETPPSWTLADIKKTHKVPFPLGSLGNQPVFEADMQNLFVVVELADHHVTVLDGDKFEAITRFKTHNALHGGPKYSSDGRYVFFASRDGWITKYDLYNLKTVAEIRVGINTRNVAVSADNRFVMVGNTLPHTAVLLNAEDLSPLKVIEVKDENNTTSRVSAVYTAAPRNSFILALKDIPEVWEIPYQDGENSKAFEIQRLALDNFLDDFFFSQNYRYIIGAARPKGERKIQGGQVIDLQSKQKVTDIPIPGMPHLSSGITWNYKDTRVMAIPNIKDGSITIIDMKDWKKIKTLKTLGPGFFMRSHSRSPYAWVDVFFGPHKEAVHIIDKQRLEIVETLRPAPGKTAAHVEFTKDGKYALLSIWDKEGALVIYDAQSLQEIKRIAMKKPSGKYNVYNKTHLDEGTSH